MRLLNRNLSEDLIQFTKFSFSEISPHWLLFTQLLCTVPVMIFDAYSAMLLFDFFVPVTGRMGVAINPEFVILLMSLFVALCFVFFTVYSF